jgi:hypothetical protein
MNKTYRSLTLAAVIAVVLAGYAGIDAAIAGPPSPATHRAPSAATTPPAGTSTTTMTVNGCEFTVTYTWSGFTGRNLIASFGLYKRVGTLDESFNLSNVEGQMGKSGSLTHTFQLTANASASRSILARGALEDSRKYHQISGTSSASKNMVTSTCG